MVDAEALRAWLQFGELEVQVVGADDVAVRVVAEHDDTLALVGTTPRWVKADGWQVASAWRVPVDADVDELVALLSALGRVGDVRVVPAGPDDATIGPCWIAAGPTWFVRLHDGIGDRDMAPPVVERARQPIDPPSARPVRYPSADRDGIEVMLGPIATRRDLDRVLRALPLHDYAPVAQLAYAGSEAVVWLWRL
jgi:hypothetical protein